MKSKNNISGMLIAFIVIKQSKTHNRILYIISINTQMIIQNRALSLARYLGLSADNHLDGQNGYQ